MFSNDASLLLPTSGRDGSRLHRDGLAADDRADHDPIRPTADTNLRAFLTIVGTKDGVTTVTINAKAAVVAGGSVPAMAIGDTSSRSRWAPSTSSTSRPAPSTPTSRARRCRADQPVAVFSGSEASDVPRFTTLSERQCCADHLEEQLFPNIELGTQFVAVKSAERTKYVKEAGGDIATIRENEWFRVLGTEEFTNVTTSLPPPQDTFQVVRRGFKTIEADRDFTISASAPIIVGQFNGSQQTTGIPNSLPGGDPSFTLLPPVEQFRTSYNFLVPNKYAFDFLLIAAPVGANLTYDGGPMPERCTMESAGTLKIMNDMVEFNAIKCPLSMPKIIPNMPSPKNVDPGAQDDGAHVLSGDKPFGLVVYGFDSFVSYGYVGGADLRKINIK